MYIIIIGGGRVGRSLAQSLLEEGNEILVIEKEDSVCQAINEDLGSICLPGDGCEAPVLAQAGVERAEVFIAVTGLDEDNLVACQLAKHRFGVPRTVARVNNPNNEALFKKLGIDVTVSSLNLILAHIEQELPTHLFTPILTLDTAHLQVVEVKISPYSAAAGKRVKDLPLPPGSLLTLLVRRNEKPQVPTPDTILQPEDLVLAVTTPEGAEAVRLALTSEAPEEAR